MTGVARTLALWLVLGGSVWAAAPRYPSSSSWLPAFSSVLPELQLCVDQHGSDRSPSWTLVVSPEGQVRVLSVEGDSPAGEACWREALEKLRLPPHDEDDTELQVVFPLRAGRVAAPLELGMQARGVGPLFLHLDFASSESERLELQAELDGWLSGAEEAESASSD